MSGTKYDSQRKFQILNRLENKSSREAEKELVKLSPLSVTKTESVRELNEKLTEVKIVLDSETLKKAEALQQEEFHNFIQGPHLQLLKLFFLG